MVGFHFIFFLYLISRTNTNVFVVRGIMIIDHYFLACPNLRKRANSLNITNLNTAQKQKLIHSISKVEMMVEMIKKKKNNK